MKIVVLDGHALNPGDLDWGPMQRLGALQVYPRTPEDQVVERATGADAVLTNKTKLRKEALAQLPKLRYIGVLATGYDCVDIATAREHTITVTNIPTYGTNTVAQFATALMLELCHHVGRHERAVNAGEWTTNPDWTFWKTPQIELAGKTLGIAGFGRIGRQMGEIGNALGMRVLAHDIPSYRVNPPSWPGFRFAEIDELLREADVVSLHCPLTPETRGMINAASLKHMKPSAFLVNSSRGPLIVEQDLADALNHGRLAGAALDVLSSEPPPADNPLLMAKHCIITPHMAWSTGAARGNLMNTAVENLTAYLAGKPVNVVS